MIWLPTRPGARRMHHYLLSRGKAAAMVQKSLVKRLRLVLGKRTSSCLGPDFRVPADFGGDFFHSDIVVLRPGQHRLGNAQHIAVIQQLVAVAFFHHLK